MAQGGSQQPWWINTTTILFVARKVQAKPMAIA